MERQENHDLPQLTLSDTRLNYRHERSNERQTNVTLFTGVVNIRLRTESRNSK